MKKIIFSGAVAIAALAVCVGKFTASSHANITGAPPGYQVNASDTVPKKDTTKPPLVYAFAAQQANDTVPKKDTTKPPFALVASVVNDDTVPKPDTTKPAPPPPPQAVL